MATVHFKTKEFKEILKSFSKFASHSNTLPIITMDFNPFRMVMLTDHAFISATPVNVSIQTPVLTYSFNPEILLNLPLTGEDVALYWDKPDGELHLKNGYLTTTLKVAVPTPSFDFIPDKMKSFNVPMGILTAINKFLSVPFTYFSGNKEDKDLMPIVFTRNSEGCLEAHADDGYSLARVTTEVLIEEDFYLQIPKYMLDSIYNKSDFTDIEPTKIGYLNSKSLLSNNIIQIYATGMTSETANFEKVYSQFKPMTSCDFNPRLLSEAIKPLVSIIPKKDQTGTILEVHLKDHMKMEIKHKDIGEAEIGMVDGIENIYHENNNVSYKINMHPKSFQEYTNLFALDKGRMFANNKIVYYTGSLTVAESNFKVEYLFPTVMV